MTNFDEKKLGILEDFAYPPGHPLCSSPKNSPLHCTLIRSTTEEVPFGGLQKGHLEQRGVEPTGEIASPDPKEIFCLGNPSGAGGAPSKHERAKGYMTNC
jgi:hypothetical protein